MSRAFVSESDMDYEGDIPEFKSPLPNGTRNYITPEGAKKLQEELRLLVEDKRPKLSKLVSKYMYEGDAADNNALKIAKYDLIILDREIEYLSELMRTAEIVQPAVSNDKVIFGKTVRVLDESLLNEPLPNDNTKVKEYRIVGVYESDPDSGLISWISPVAKALKGSRVGETVTINLPENTSKLKIISIK